MVGVNASDAAHVFGCLVRPQHLASLVGRIVQTRQGRANPVQTLSVPPILNTREASLPLPPPKVFIFNQLPKTMREPRDIPSRWGVAVHAVANEIGHAAHLPGNQHWKAGAHGFVYGKAPRFVFRWQHKHVYCTIQRWQFGLVDEAGEYDIVEPVLRAETAQFRLELSGASHHHRKRSLALILELLCRFEEIARTFAPCEFRRVEHRWSIRFYLVPLADLDPLLVSQLCSANKA